MIRVYAVMQSKYTESNTNISNLIKKGGGEKRSAPPMGSPFGE